MEVLPVYACRYATTLQRISLPVWDSHCRLRWILMHFTAISPPPSATLGVTCGHTGLLDTIPDFHCDCFYLLDSVPFTISCIHIHSTVV